MRPRVRTLCCCGVFLSLCTLVVVAEAQVRYPRPVEKPRPPVGADGKPLVTIDGRWYSDFGYMELSQDQWTFEGTYSCCVGKIHGEFVGEKIEFFWQDPIYGQGWGYFRLDDDAQRLQGIWGVEHDMGSSGGWRAVRLEPRRYDGETTRWRFTALHPQLGEVRGQAVLGFAAERTAGQLEGAASGQTPAQEKTQRHEVFRYLDGHRRGDEIRLRWYNPLTQREGDMHLKPSGDSLEGRWHITDEVMAPIHFEPIPESGDALH